MLDVEKPLKRKKKYTRMSGEWYNLGPTLLKF